MTLLKLCPVGAERTLSGLAWDPITPSSLVSPDLSLASSEETPGESQTPGMAGGA